MIAVRLVIQTLTGVVLGSILGAIITGDYVYNIVWGVGLALLFLVAGFAGSRHARAQRAVASPGRPQGIIQRMTGVRVAGSSPPAGAVLNPPPTATPSHPTILNGEPVAADDPATQRMLAIRDRPRIPPWRRALALAVVLVAAALVLLPAARTIGWMVSDAASGRWDGRDPRTGIHQQEMVDDLAAVIGSYEFTRVGFYDSYVIVDAPTSPGAGTTDTYMWRYGRAWREGPELIQPDDLDAELFDASSIDFTIVGEVTRDAMADAAWPSFDSILPTVLRDPADPAGDPVIMVSLASPYYAATYTYTTDGALVRKDGTGID